MNGVTGDKTHAAVAPAPPPTLPLVRETTEPPPPQPPTTEKLDTPRPIAAPGAPIKRKVNTWNEHVKLFRAATPGMTLKQAMQQAGATYKKKIP